MKLSINRFVASAAICMATLTVSAQLKTPAPSPTQTLDQAFALSNIKIEYSRPGVKDRVIFGDLVPYGKVWRTGANASTKVTFGNDVKIEGQPLAAGTYALYTIPNKDSWEVMFYKDLTLGGNVGSYKPENEVLKVKVTPVNSTEKTEDFTINIQDIKPTTAILELSWDKVRVPIKFTTEIDAAIMKNIEQQVVNDNRPYYAAASYYYENNKDMKLALDWADKAFKAYPQGYWIANLKAKIQIKLKDYQGAITSATESLKLSQAAQDGSYIKQNEKLIAEAKTMK